jgi:hypothetical protein
LRSRRSAGADGAGAPLQVSVQVEELLGP